MECRFIAKHNPACKPQCTQKSRKLLCPKPKVMPRFSLGDVGEARWLLSHRWTETSPILPDVAHDSRNQRRVVSLSALSLVSACFRPRQLWEVHHNSLQQALIADSTADRRRAQQPTVHLHISDVTPAPHVSGTLSIIYAFVACAAVQNSGACPVWGAMGPCRGVPPRTNVRCVVGQ